MATQWTEDQARKELDAWRASGQSMDRYAKEHCVGVHRLRYWKGRLGGAVLDARSKGVSLLPVRVVQVSGNPIEVLLPGGCVARVGRWFDEETLLRVVAVFGRR